MSGRAWLLFAAMSLIWGVPYLFIKVAVDDGVPPVFVAWSRVALGAALLLPLAAARGELRRLGGRWRAITAYAAVEIAIPFTLISVGEEHVASSLAAILIASMPLAVGLLAVRFLPEDRPSGLRSAGLVIGLAGVVALMGIDVAGQPDELLGAGLILLAALCYAAATIIIKRALADLHPLGPIGAGLGIATLALLPLTVFNLPGEAPSSDAVSSIVALGVICTALGLILFFALIAEAGPSRASVITYVNPLVAVAFGVLLLDERLGVVSLIGLGLILGGSWLSTGGLAGPQAEGEPEAGGYS